MKQGINLIELATEITRQSQAKVDYVADTRNLEMISAGERGGVVLAMHNGSTTTMHVGANAHRQIGDRLAIPKKYYDRMLAEQPDLLAANVNKWLQAEPEKRMIRTLDGTARAFLSNRYQRIDNDHVAETVLPILMKTPGVEIMSSQITESRLYIKAVTHSVRGEIKSLRRGDIVEAGVIVSNSEIGLGAVTVSPFFNFLVCTNGMIRNKEGLRQAHVGTKLDGDESLAEMLQDDTRKAIDHSVLLKLRDVMAASMSQVSLDKAIAAMQLTTDRQMTGDIPVAVEMLANDFGINDTERGSILRHLIQGGDTSQYGLINAVTRTAEDLESYDRATEFEALGGRLVDLPVSQWKRYAEAA